MENSNMDMFTKLSSSLLVLIISYLPFKEAARTSILSKQWFNLWKETTVLEFNESFFVDRDEDEDNQKAQRHVFIDFVKQIVMNYPRKAIQKFSFVYSKPKECLSDMQNFVLFAASRNVRNLGLDFSDPRWIEDDIERYPSKFELPLQVYQLFGLESLLLFSCSFDVSRFTNFSALKTVFIGWIEITEVTVNILIRNCPQIETLCLKKCWSLEHFEVSVQNSSLKNLILDKCHFMKNMIWVEGPRLQFFKYSGEINQFYLMNPMDMVEADLDFSMEPEFDELGTILCDFLQEFYAARVLTVCSVLLQIIPEGDDPLGLPAPINTRHLIVKTAMHENELVGIKFMLRSCRYIHTLTFDIVPGKIFPDYTPPFELAPQELWTKKYRMNTCINHNLRVVNVKGFKGSDNEIYVLRFIIQFGANLEQVNLYISDEETEDGENRDIYISKIRYIITDDGALSKKLRIFIF
ncbi:hypothetical protein JCGZ_00838 [Jatropha curcas]|uniref:Uncharacterized protein n=1 Tax=Jatropha curcas TaxID=180498 RepID=A0A067KS84_JATCU|nr:putative F-box/LRR-repeat protein At1g56400 [Jatropha curcas]KDP39081.1 hypothetical protein JCGZ_00838 [Jatropha curcas]